jgi:hypothetical protein
MFLMALRVLGPHWVPLHHLDLLLHLVPLFLEAHLDQEDLMCRLALRPRLDLLLHLVRPLLTVQRLRTDLLLHLDLLYLEDHLNR